MEKDVDDTINVGTAFHLLESNKPMACCPRDCEPLIATFEFKGAEFYCVICDGKFGFLAPVPKSTTPELQARHDELRKIYDEARKERNG